MKRIEKTVVKLIILAIFFSQIFPGNVFGAGKKAESAKKQIIFLMDASKSMEEDGHWTDAADSVCMIAAALPDGYETALLVYNTEIVLRVKFGEINQKTRHRLENTGLQGYTAPSVALEKAIDMFDADAADRRVVFISDGEISMREKEDTKKEIRRFKNTVDAAGEQNIKIDMLAVSGNGVENQTAYGTEVTSGKLYSFGKKHTAGETAAKYLFQTLKTERTELGQAVSDSGNMDIDLQDTCMKYATVVFLSEEKILDFHIVGQCEKLSMMQGNKFAVARLKNPLEEKPGLEYTLAKRGNVRAYLVKEYYLTAETQKPYVSEDGEFVIKTDIVNHQGKPVLEEGHLRDFISVSINGNAESCDVENGSAVIRYRTDQTITVKPDAVISIPGSIIHYKNNTDTIELAVPAVEEETDYTVLIAVVAVLAFAVLFLTVMYRRKSSKKKSGGRADSTPAEIPVVTKYDYSGQVTVYLLKGEQEEDLPPCSVRLFGRPQKSITFDQVKEQCGIHYGLADADKIRFSGGKEHSLCFRNSGTATVMKENQILKREKKYSLYYGEKLLLIFNDGGTEIELHYKNIKPGER